MRRRSVSVCLAVLAASACTTLSQGLRPTVLEPGDLRVGAAIGSSRDLGADFSLANPGGARGLELSSAGLAELSAHIGVVEGIDLGLRIRPFTPGGKVEGLFRLLDERDAGVNLLVGLGGDFFYRSRVRLGCDEDGCFSREYWGLAGDVPLVVSSKLGSHSVWWFIAARYQHLFVTGSQRYQPRTEGFSAQVVEKQSHQPFFGWAIGMEFRGETIRFMPRFEGSTVRMPSGKLVHARYWGIDLAAVFNLFGDDTPEPPRPSASEAPASELPPLPEVTPELPSFPEVEPESDPERREPESDPQSVEPESDEPEPTRDPNPGVT